jgi:hypothetical protein
MATIFENLRRSAYQRPWMKDYKGGIGNARRPGESGYLQQDGYLQPGDAVPKMAYYSASTPGVQYSSFDEALAVGKEAQDSQDINDYVRYANNLGLPQTPEGFDGYRKEKAQQRQLEQQTSMKNAEIARQQANRNREFVFKMAQARESAARANRAAAQSDQRNRLSYMNYLQKLNKGTGTGRGGSRGGTGSGGSSSSQINRLMSGIKSGAYNMYDQNEIGQLVKKYGGDEIDYQTALDYVNQSRSDRGTKAGEAANKVIDDQTKKIEDLLTRNDLTQLRNIDVSAIPHDQASILHNKIADTLTNIETDRENLELDKQSFDSFKKSILDELNDPDAPGSDSSAKTQTEEIQKYINGVDSLKGSGSFKQDDEGKWVFDDRTAWDKLPDNTGEGLADVSPFASLFMNNWDDQEVEPGIPGYEYDPKELLDAGPVTSEDLPLDQPYTSPEADAYINAETEATKAAELRNQQEEFAETVRGGASDLYDTAAEQADRLNNYIEANRLRPIPGGDYVTQEDIDEFSRLTEPEKYADPVAPARVGRNTMFNDPSTPWDMGSTVEGSSIPQGTMAWENLKAIPAQTLGMIPDAINAVKPFYTAGVFDSEPQETIRQPMLNPIAYTGVDKEGKPVRPRITASQAQDLIPRYMKTFEGMPNRDPNVNEYDYMLEKAVALLMENYDVVDPEFLLDPTEYERRKNL